MQIKRKQAACGIQEEMQSRNEDRAETVAFSTTISSVLPFASLQSCRIHSGYEPGAA